MSFNEADAAAQDVETTDVQASRLPSVSSADIDRVNLRQALLDFELANVRVVDLTSRLTTLHQQLLTAQHDLSVLRIAQGDHNAAVRDLMAGREFAEYERNVARAELHAVRVSRSYRIGRLITKALRVMPGTP
jgi:hypothetical protein